LKVLKAIRTNNFRFISNAIERHVWQNAPAIFHGKLGDSLFNGDFMKKQVFAMASLALAAAPSFASDFYFLADAGQSKLEIDVDGATLSTTDNAISFGAGYSFRENFAIEFAYRDLGEISEDYRENLGGGDYYDESVSLSSTALQLSLVGALALGEAAHLYGRVGLARLEAEATYSYSERINGWNYSESESATTSKTKAVFGAGLSYSFTPVFAWRGEYSQYAEW